MDDDTDMDKGVAPGPPGADVVQMPIRLTHQLVDELFGSKKDDEGLPRYRYQTDTQNRAMVWSEFVPMLHEWLSAGGTATYYSIETRFELWIESRSA